MAFPNRELSQFGSFLIIDDNGNTIGIATNSTPSIGIGTTSSDVKLTVIGDTNISGIVRASQYFKGNEELVDVTIDRWNTDNDVDIYRLTGNVGIGKSTPTEKLDVEGNISAERIISTVPYGTAPFVINSDTLVPLLNASFLEGKSAPSGTIVGDVDNQLIKNKTISDSSIITTGFGITFNGSTSGSASLRAQPVATSNNIILPSTNGTLVSTGDTGSVTSTMILNETITNADISAGAGISYTKLALGSSIVNSDISNGTIQNVKLANSTISGVSLGGTLSNLIAGSYVNYNSGTTYNGSNPITININGSTATSGGNNLVARDSNGDFSTRNINLSNLTASQQIQAVEFNSTNNIRINSTVIIDSNRNINAGVVTATRFVGDGSGLSNVIWVRTSAGIHTLSRVGVGTTNPQTSLDVAGDVRVSGAVTATRFVGDGSGLTNLTGSQWITTSAGIHTLSKVGMGTTNPQTSLDVAGDVRISGIVTASAFSGTIIRTSAQGTFSNMTFGPIPLWVKKITVMVNLLSLNLNGDFMVQLAWGNWPSGLIYAPFDGISYAGAVNKMASTGNLVTSFGTNLGFLITTNASSSSRYCGNIYLTNIGGNTWTETSCVSDNTSIPPTIHIGSGGVNLPNPLTAIRIYPVSLGSFDNGSVSIMYEG